MVLAEGGTTKADGVAGIRQLVALVDISEKGCFSLVLSATG